MIAIGAMGCATAPKGIPAPDPEIEPFAEHMLEPVYEILDLRIVLHQVQVKVARGTTVRGPGGAVEAGHRCGRRCSGSSSSRAAWRMWRRRGLLYGVERSNDGRTVPMTLGWHVGELGGERIYYKEGGGGGYHCEMRIYPGSGVASVIMVNETGSTITKLEEKADRLFLQARGDAR